MNVFLINKEELSAIQTFFIQAYYYLVHLVGGGGEGAGLIDPQGFL